MTSRILMHRFVVLFVLTLCAGAQQVAGGNRFTARLSAWDALDWRHLSQDMGGDNRSGADWCSDFVDPRKLLEMIARQAI
jgi:hypothetical protein